MKPEDILTVPGARIQVKIEENTPQGAYHDALYYTPEEWAKLTQSEITAAKAARVNNWIAFVAAQSSKPPVVPTKEELLARELEMQDQIERLTDQVIAAKPTAEELIAIKTKLQERLAKLNAVAAVVGK